MFDVHSAKDRLSILVSNYNKLIWDPLNVSLAEKCCLDAWHLADWHYDEVAKSKNTLKRYRLNLFKECPEMEVLHDLSNTFKHKTLERPKAKIQQGNKHEGPFSQDFSKDHDTSRLEIIMATIKRLILTILIRVAIDYWRAKV